jgi:orotate phosphoribosyltransferase
MGGAMTVRSSRAPTAERDLSALGQELVAAALLRGDFVLSSGARSSYYVDKYRFETMPGLLRGVAQAMTDLVPAGTDRLAGTELGAVALATALALETGLPFVIVRKEAKGYSTGKVIEGNLETGDRVLLVEDVVTTGAQSIKAARRLIEAGAVVEQIIAVVDREEGGLDAAAAAGFHLRALFSRSSLAI